jgi:protein-tyrosine phosphatase
MLNLYFRNNFGGRLPFLKLLKSRILTHLGGYRSERDVDWSKVRRLVYVCKGNINRSPFAESYSRDRIKLVSSLGLETHNGKPASDEALRNAEARGIELSGHQTRQIDDFDFLKGDLLIGFEPNQTERLRQMRLADGVQVTLLGIWGDSRFPYIQDPICREDRYFQSCYTRIERSIDGLLKRVPVSVP